MRLFENGRAERALNEAGSRKASWLGWAVRSLFFRKKKNGGTDAVADAFVAEDKVVRVSLFSTQSRKHPSYSMKCHRPPHEESKLKEGISFDATERKAAVDAAKAVFGKLEVQHSRAGTPLVAVHMDVGLLKGKVVRLGDPIVDSLVTSKPKAKARAA